MPTKRLNPEKFTETELLDLPFKYVMNVCQTNKRINKICNDDSFWRTYFRNNPSQIENGFLYSLEHNNSRFFVLLSNFYNIGNTFSTHTKAIMTQFLEDEIRYLDAEIQEYLLFKLDQKCFHNPKKESLRSVFFYQISHLKTPELQSKLINLGPDYFGKHHFENGIHNILNDILYKDESYNSVQLKNAIVLSLSKKKY